MQVNLITKVQGLPLPGSMKPTLGFIKIKQ